MYMQDKMADIDNEDDRDFTKSKQGVTQDVLVTSREDTLQPDGGWGWVVCFSSFLCNGTIFGTINAFGILFVAIRDEYGQGDPYVSSKAALVGSLNLGLTYLMSAVSSILSDKIGIRSTGLIGGVLASVGMIGSAFIEELMLLYLTFGVLLGLGFGLVYNQSLVILGHYFKRHLALASGISTVGGNVAAVAFSLGLPSLIDAVGLRYTFLIISILSVLMIPCALTWKSVIHKEKSCSISRESPSGKNREVYNVLRRYMNLSIWQNRNYVVYSISQTIAMLGFFVPVVHVVKYSDDTFPDRNGSILVLCISGTASIAQLVMGKMADSECANRLRLQQTVSALQGICIVCIPLCQSYAVLTAVTVFIGVCYGSYVCLLAPNIFDLVGDKNASQAMGFFLAFLAIPSTIGPFLAGLVYDKMKSYDLAFYVGGCCMLAGASMMCFIRTPCSCRQTIVLETECEMEGKAHLAGQGPSIEVDE